MKMVLEDYTFVTCVERIDRGKRKVSEYLSDVDEGKFDKYMNEQIEVVGGEIVYQNINNCLKQGIVELSLLKELCDLYKWRRRFFDEHLPVLKGSWFTDSFCRDVITFQIAENFDQVLQIASSRQKLEGTFATGLFLTSDGIQSRRLARYRIDNLEILYHLKDKTVWSYYFLSEKFLPGCHLLFSDVAKIISDHWSKSPKRLEELSMMSMKKLKFSSDKRELAEHLIFNDKYGFYLPEDEVPSHLMKEGTELFTQLISVYEKIRLKDTSVFLDPWNVDGSIEIDN